MSENSHDTPLSTTTPEQWQVEIERVICCAGKLLRLARRGLVVSAVIELVRTLPRSAEEMKILQSSVSGASLVKKQFSTHPSLFVRCAIEAYHFSQDDKELFQAVIEYWRDFTMMPPERRAMLEASVVGTLLGYGMG